MFNLLCELCMTRNILLTAQGTAYAVNCGACLPHVALISATDTPRTLCGIAKINKNINWGENIPVFLNLFNPISLFSQDRKQDEMLFCFGVFKSLGFTSESHWPIALLSVRHQ